MATDTHELVKTVSHEPAAVVGHGIGMMVAYAYAARYPQDTSKVALMDACLPGSGHWLMEEAPRQTIAAMLGFRK